MIKFNVLLLLAVVISGMLLIHVQHENRLLFAATAKENGRQLELELDGKRLLLARQSLVTPTRVSEDANNLLGMRVPSLGVMEYIPEDEDELWHFEAQIPSHVSFVEAVREGS